MEIKDWIDQDAEQIFDSDIFSKYFDTTDVTIVNGFKYMVNKDKGIDIVLRDDFTISTVHLFSDNYEDHRGFPGELPLKLNFNFSKQTVRQLLGEPKKTGGGHQSLFIDYVYPWDKYYFYGVTYNIRYPKEKNNISMVSIGSMKLEGELNSDLQ